MYRAADWLFSHVEDLDAAVNEVFGRATASTAGSGSSGGDSGAVLDDGDGKYTLRAIISHIGKNTDHGHYVCHILKNGEWYFYNDEKVRGDIEEWMTFFLISNDNRLQSVRNLHLASDSCISIAEMMVQVPSSCKGNYLHA